MADTVRTKAGLISLYADNSAGGISEQDGRDHIVSVLGVYAQIHVTGNGAAQTGIGTGFSTLDFGNGGGNGISDNAIADYANDRIEIGAQGAGDYQIFFQGSVSGSASTKFTFRIAINGTPATGLVCKQTLDASGNTLSYVIPGAATLADGAYITVEVAADGASKQIILEEAQLIVKRLG